MPTKKTKKTETIDERDALAASVDNWIAEATSIVIDNEFAYDDAATVLKANKALQDEAHRIFDPICNAAHAAWRMATKQRGEVIEPLETHEKRLKTGMASFLDRRRRAEAEERRRLEAVARKEAEERRRAELDALKAEAEARKAAGDAAAAEIVELAAVQVQSAPIEVAPIVATREPVKVEGISSTINYSAEVVDLPALAAFAVANPAMMHMLISANEKEIKAMARRQKDSFSVPGCRLVKTTSIRSGR